MLIANNPFHPEMPKPESSTVELPLFVIRNPQFEIHAACPLPEPSERKKKDAKRTQESPLAPPKTPIRPTKRTQTNPRKDPKTPKRTHFYAPRRNMFAPFRGRARWSEKSAFPRRRRAEPYCCALCGNEGCGLQHGRSLRKPLAGFVGGEEMNPGHLDADVHILSGGE